MNITATTYINTYRHTLPLHVALPISASLGCVGAILLSGRAVGEGTGQAWPVYLAAGCLAALVPLVTNFDLRMQRNVVPVEDAVAAIVAGLCLLALSFGIAVRSEEHTSELQSLMRTSYAVFCLKKKTTNEIRYVTTLKDQLL